MLRRNLFSMLALLLVSIVACAQMNPETREKLAGFAGTILQIAGANYTGPHQQMAQSLITAFNGQPVEETQAIYNLDDPYGVHMDDVYDYGDQYGAGQQGNDYGGASSQDFGAGYDDSLYQEAGYYPAGTPSLDAALIGVDDFGELVLVENGATLQGPDNEYPGDRVGVAFAPANDAYVYVVAIDGTGWTQSLFPDSVLGHRNPVPAGTEVLLPGESLYGLDNVPGVETVYILASNTPRHDIEEQMAPYFGKERPPAAGTTYRSVERPILITRGLTNLRPAAANQAGAAVSANADTGGVAPVMNSFLAADGADELAVTLWFNHR
jgi:hypothetical protein